VFEKDKTNMLSLNVASLSKRGKDILDAKYETKYSKYTFETPQEVKSRESFVQEKFETLKTKSAAKKDALQKALEIEEQKEKLRLLFASTANDCTRWVKDTLDALSVAQFGFSLKEVEAYATKLSESDKDISGQATKYQQTVTKTYADMKGLGVTESPYTSVKVADVDKMASDVAAAQKQRGDAYKKELERQRANDALCKKFSDAAIPFTKSLLDNKGAVSNNSAAMEAQVSQLKERIVSADKKEGARLPEIKSIQGQMDTAGIQTNPYTLLSFKDVDVQWQQYLSFLQRKQKQLEDEIAHKKLRGITPEQMEEINKQFTQYDTSGNKMLEPSEMKACLFSLGHDADMLSVKKIMKQYGGKETEINYDGFKEFMIAQLGDTDTKDEILLGFKLINNGSDVAIKDHLGQVLPDDAVTYILTNAPKKGNGADYAALTAAMFAR